MINWGAVLSLSQSSQHDELLDLDLLDQTRSTPTTTSTATPPTTPPATPSNTPHATPTPTPRSSAVSQVDPSDSTPNATRGRRSLRGRSSGRSQPNYVRLGDNNRGHRLNPYNQVNVVGGAYIRPVRPEEWRHDQLRYRRMGLLENDGPNSLFEFLKIRYTAGSGTWYHSFGASLATIENMITFSKGTLLVTKKRIIPIEDSVLLVLKWFKWNHSYASLGEPFGIGKSSVDTIISKMLPILLVWADQYVVMKEEDELRQITAERTSHESCRDYLYIVDTIPTRIRDMSGPLAREFNNVHKRYSHIKTQAVVDLRGHFLHVSATYRGVASDITIFRESNFGHYVTNGITIIADSIYIGLRESLNGGNMLIPFRRDQGELSAGQMSHNSFLSTYRVVVEHSFGSLKNFEIIRFFRSDFWKFNTIFKICCALHNIHSGMELIESESEDGRYGDVNVLEGRAISTFTQMADDFVVIPQDSQVN